RGRADSLFRAAPALLNLRAEGGVRLSPKSLAPLSGQVSEVLESLGALGSLTAGEEEPELSMLGRRCRELLDELDFIRQAASTDHVYWAEARGRGTFLRAAPIEVASELRSRLYGAVDTIVFTSATLTAAGRFDYFANRMGLI